MAFWSLVSRVPWRQVLRYAPHVLDHTDRLLDYVRASRARPVDVRDAESDLALGDVEGRLRSVEQAQVTQGELLAQLAGQLEKLAQAVRTLSARVTLALWLSTGALVLAVVALLLRLF